MDSNLQFQIESKSEYCIDVDQLIKSIKILYVSDKNFKNTIDIFLTEFNTEMNSELIIEDIIDTESYKNLPIEKLKLINKFVLEKFKNFSIGINTKDGYISIDGTIDDIKKSVDKITFLSEKLSGDEEKVRKLGELIINLLERIKDTVKEILEIKTKSLISQEKNKRKKELIINTVKEKILLMSLDNQKKFIISIYNFLTGENIDQLGKNHDISLKIKNKFNENLGLDGKVDILYKLFFHNKKLDKKSNKYLKSFIKLLEKKEIYQFFIESFGLQKEIELIDKEEIVLSDDEYFKKQQETKIDITKRNNKKRSSGNEKGKEFTFEELANTKKQLVNYLHNLTIHEQYEFFIAFCGVIRSNVRYSIISSKSNTDTTLIYNFIGKLGYNSILNLLVHKNQKIGKPILGKFVDKIGKNTDLCTQVSKLLGLDTKIFESLQNQIIDNTDSHKINEKERKNGLLVKAKILSTFRNLSIEKQREFFLNIHFVLTGKDYRNKKLVSEEIYDIEDSFNKLLKTNNRYIFNLFYGDGEKIKGRRYIDKMSLKLITDTKIIDCCIDFFSLEKELYKDELDNGSGEIGAKTSEKGDEMKFVPSEWTIISKSRNKKLDTSKFKESISSDEPTDIKIVNSNLNKQELQNYINGFNVSDFKEFIIMLYEKLKKDAGFAEIMGKRSEINGLKNLFIEYNSIKDKIEEVSIYNTLNNLLNGKNIRKISKDKIISYLIEFFDKNNEVLERIDLGRFINKGNLKTEEVEVIENDGIGKNAIGEGNDDTEKGDNKSLDASQNTLNSITGEPTEEDLSETDFDDGFGLQVPDLLGERQELIDRIVGKTGSSITKGSPKYDNRGFLIDTTTEPEEGYNAGKGEDIELKSTIKVGEFIPYINQKISERLKQKYPNKDDQQILELSKDYEIFEGHFTSIMAGTSGYIFSGMISKLPKRILDTKRWLNIKSIINIKDLENLLFDFILINTTKN